MSFFFPPCQIQWTKLKTSPICLVRISPSVFPVLCHASQSHSAIPMLITWSPVPFHFCKSTFILFLFHSDVTASDKVRLSSVQQWLHTFSVAWFTANFSIGVSAVLPNQNQITSEINGKTVTVDLKQKQMQNMWELMNYSSKSLQMIRLNKSGTFCAFF